MHVQVEVKDKETRETIEETLREKKDEQLCRQGGCFSWIRKKNRKGKENQRRNNIIFLINNVC